MTPLEFQTNNSGELKKVLTSPMGIEFFGILNGLRPAIPENHPNESSMIRSYAKSEGYEICLRNIVALTNPPKLNVQPEANYGIEDKKTEIK